MPRVAEWPQVSACVKVFSKDTGFSAGLPHFWPDSRVEKDQIKAARNSVG
jgi:hypothetical protein